MSQPKMIKMKLFFCVEFIKIKHIKYDTFLPCKQHIVCIKLCGTIEGIFVCFIKRKYEVEMLCNFISSCTHGRTELQYSFIDDF